ncbi:P-loop containing nucleoside triphosphate hydrolase protein [Phaeosphaeria sp. MPI-PUGE-AT-0046c]|nr:P-loop containing nucleoside triphosphate hydrolase protein [Phaeosphaeria sp. MPI-PUGE-AT-0046c]
MDSDYDGTASEIDTAMAAESSGGPEKDSLAQAVEKGSCCDIKDLYRLPRADDPKKFYWADDKPKDFGNEEKGKTKKAREAFAVNILHKFNDDKDEWEIHEVRVNSARLQKALETILEGYPGLTQHELKSFSPLFRPLVHQWQIMLDYTDKCEPGTEMFDHLQLFRKVLEPLLEKSFETVDSIQKTGHQRLLTQPKVRCFNIEKKKWENLAVTKLHQIPWAERAFDSLVLAQDEKDLLLALVDRDQFSDGKPFEDFIGAKGQGMIMLLCGPPGVGKTLTAESVAEHLRRPLYKLGAGDLGTSAQYVERNLSKALALCGHFGAVLLIDEADVFMEARSTNNIVRNELVSVFLRLLEYYSGIMILTTNRMRSIDTAFESRVDITLSYNPLTESDRKQVWKNFLATFEEGTVDVSEVDLIKLAKWDFNGRQIKSAIKTAKVLATKKKERLNAKHLGVVLTLRSKALGMMSEEEEKDGLASNGVVTNGF